MLRHLYVNMKQNEIIHLKLFMIVLMSCIPEKTYLCQRNLSWSLETLTLDGHITFDNNDFAARDFGNTHHLPPWAVLHPRSVSDISATLDHIHNQGPASGLTVAARGHGHSLQGQSQAHRGLVIHMESLREGQKIRVVNDEDGGSPPFADVSGGELWIDILRETLRHGLAPKSWTDYLYLTVGGTLSNAGISGQAFRHGPQISNVHELEVVTGKGEVVNCSERENRDLFHAVLGGLGQFGIITRARISLEPASEMVKWIRVLYSDFSLFSEDQEHLISSQNSSLDYIEGFVIINKTGLLNSWRSSFDPNDPVRASQFSSDGRTLYCIEMAMYFNPNNKDVINKKIEKLLSELSFIPSTVFLSEVTYLDFLNRVYISQQKLQAQGLWDVPHPWLNLLVPKRNIHKFAKGVFGNIVKYSSNGPILIYPMNKSKWNNKTSLVTPEGDEIIYLVGFLSSAVPSSTGKDGLEHILTRNRKILEFCERARLGTKQYLPHYGTQEEWRGHFGPKWPVFLRRKLAYDPFATLGPGHRIFEKATRFRDA